MPPTPPHTHTNTNTNTHYYIEGSHTRSHAPPRLVGRRPPPARYSAGGVRGRAQAQEGEVQKQELPFLSQQGSLLPHYVCSRLPRRLQVVPARLPALASYSAP